MPTSQVWVQLAVYLALLAAIAWPVGAWLAAVGEGRLPRWLTPIVKLEGLFYRACRRRCLREHVVAALRRRRPSRST